MHNKLEFFYNNFCSCNKCEMIEIIGFPKKDQPFLIFTLVVFEKTRQKNIEEFLTQNLQKIKGIENISWGINRRIIDIESVNNFYNSLIENIYSIESSSKIKIGHLKLLPEQYVQANNDFISPQMNYVLKNNFYNGSYIVEFFDEEKVNNKFLLNDPVLLNNFSEQISQILPLRIANLSDRLGNIIFQFPINFFRLKYSSIKKENPRRYAGIKIEIFSQVDNLNLQDFEVKIFEENDNIITRQKTASIQNQVTEIPMDDCFGTNLEIRDIKTSLLLYKNKFSIMKHMGFNLGFGDQQKRIFELNGKFQEIEVVHNVNHSNYGKNVKKEFIDWIQDRRYENELQELEQEKYFIQYFGYKGEDIKALEDIRYLIDKYSERGVYVWDPYLSAEDIKKTLYFCKNASVPLKAITGFSSVNENSKEQVKTNIQSELDKDNKQFLFMNLEVRGKFGSHGYDFHDRFLIFPLENPKVWSLGISINQLGKSHHILQKIKNARHVLNAFNQLWDALNHKDCLIWKSN